MKKLCENPYCQKPLVRKTYEGPADFRRRKTCNPACAKISSGYKRRKNKNYHPPRKALKDSAYPSGNNPKKPTPENEWRRGTTPAIRQCGDCRWIATNGCCELWEGDLRVRFLYHDCAMKRW